MNPIGYVAIEYSSGGSPMEVVDGVIRESAEDIREVTYGLNRIPGDERYESAVIVHIDDLERLTAERDEARAGWTKAVEIATEASNQRDQALAALETAVNALRSGT